MTVTKVLARGFTFELNTGTEAVPVWQVIKGINTFTPSPQKNDADTTTFDEDGDMSHLAASRGDELTLAGKYLEDEGTGARDPGQEAVEAWAAEIGPSSLKRFRQTSPGGNMVDFLASASVTSGGGGNDDAANWEVGIKRSGPKNFTPAA